MTSQIDIKSASFRVLRESPAHVVYGVWINGGKCGDLTVRVEEVAAFDAMMRRGGFSPLALAPDVPQPGTIAEYPCL